MKVLHDLEKHKDLLLEQINNVPFNTLFAENVINQIVNGEIFVDNVEYPQTFYILHPYGMSLLLGESSNEFCKGLNKYILNSNGKRTKIEWMQAYPEDWHAILKKMVVSNTSNQMPSIEIDTRVNFKFNKSKYIELNQSSSDKDIKVLRTSIEDFEEMGGSVIPKYFWNSSDDFIKNGVGYSLFYQNSIASIAFSSVINSKYLELGIETQEQFRGRNFAYKACSALIDYCLNNDLEPIWACRKTNVGSYRLAEKLSFEESLTTPYYKLNY